MKNFWNLFFAFVLCASFGFQSAVAKTQGHKKHKVKAKKRMKKKSHQAKKNTNTDRKPAQASVIETYVFDEFTSFEDLLKKKDQMERNPSSFDVKARVISVRRDIGLNDKEDEKKTKETQTNRQTPAR
jgi:hypothetical protein